MTGLRHGRYCLVSTADPHNLLRESNNSNNARRTRIALHPAKHMVKRLAATAAAAVELAAPSGLELAPARPLGLAGLAGPVRLGRGRRVAQVPLGVERAHAAGAGGGDRLAVGVVDEVADREDAGRGWSGSSRPRSGRSRPRRSSTWPRDQLGARDVADRDEGAADLELLGLAGLGVAEAHLARACRRRRRRTPPARTGVLKLMLGLLAARSSMIFEARNSSRRWTIVRSEANLEMKIESSIAESPPPITTTFSPLKKAPSQTPQVETPRPPSSSSPGMPSRFGSAPIARITVFAQVLVVADEDALDAAVGELDPGRVVGDEAGPEPLGLGAELLHHLRPHDPLGEAGVVLDVGRVLELAAPLEALDHERLEVGAGRVERRRVAGGRAADDDHVLDSLARSRSLRLARALPFRLLVDTILYFLK